jgi:membrane protease YdiL (CAAX protease family)
MTGMSKKTYRWKFAVLLPLWVFIGFAVSRLAISLLAVGLDAVGVPLKTLNHSVFNAAVAASIYVLTLVIVLNVPRLIKKFGTSREELGLTRLPSWTDIGLAPAGFVVYFLLSAVLVYVVTHIFPGFDISQAQNVGFENLGRYYELMLAFVTLVIIAPIAEELLFRGYLYGKLRNAVPIWAAILITSVLFGLIHGQWNVAVDVFALSIVMCVLREVTGGIWAGILLHMLKNGLAFYILFINPTMFTTIGG